ncbi:MAG: hypothetical protein ACOX0F_13770 [Syntrophomonadaceae bacterium]|jgi:hypothetical protein
MLDFIQAYIKPGPPDQDCKVFRDGQLVKVMPAFPDGWDDWKNNKKQHGFKGRKENSTVAKTRIPWVDMWPKCLELFEQGLTKKEVSEELGIPGHRLKAKIDEEKELNGWVPPWEKELQQIQDSNGFATEDDKPIKYTITEAPAYVDHYPKIEMDPESIMNANCKIAMAQVNSLYKNPIAVHLVKDLISKGLI